MTNRDKLNILIEARSDYLSEMHRDKYEIIRIEKYIKRTELCVESLGRSIEKLKAELAEELPGNLV